MSPSLRRGGFSLVEVICAILILGVGVAGLAEGITLALRSSKDSERITVAAELAAGRMETIRAEGYLTEGEDEGDFGDEFALYAWKQEVRSTGTDGLREVTVTVTEAKTGDGLFELNTLIFEMPLGGFRTRVGTQEREEDETKTNGIRPNPRLRGAAGTSRAGRGGP